MHIGAILKIIVFIKIYNWTIYKQDSWTILSIDSKLFYLGRARLWDR